MIGKFTAMITLHFHMIVPLPKSQTSHPEPARAPLRLPQMFFDTAVRDNRGMLSCLIRQK